jgi:uncharacterized RDD family membrane protein YckC
MDAKSDAQSAASPRWLPEAEEIRAAAVPLPGMEALKSESPTLQSAVEVSMSESQEPVPEDSPAWRQEVAARLNRYQSRRKPRPPRYPSLRLRFEDEVAAPAESSISTGSLSFAQSSQHALALNEFEFSDRSGHALDVSLSMPRTALEANALRQTAALPSTADSSQQTDLAAAPTTPATTAKIIEFPRSWMPPTPPLDELAEPVMSRPRILEAPDAVPPPPALGGITIEPAQQSEMEKRPGIDIPLQSAPLARRILSAAIDDVIVAAACLIFAFIFSKMTALRPPRFQMVGIAAGLAGLFWAAYQYLLVVYSGTTPGLRLARLELSRFDGSHAGLRLRRWRVLASFLSALSLGMGYAWVFLDEDSLCWHDRITHTYLAPKG